MLENMSPTQMEHMLRVASAPSVYLPREFAQELHGKRSKNLITVLSDHLQEQTSFFSLIFLEIFFLRSVVKRPIPGTET